MSSRQSEIAHNLKEVLESIDGKAKLVAVSKTYPTQDIQAAYNGGQRDFGENKVQDLFSKAQALEGNKDIRWHFIGGLQSNKINMLLKTPNLVSIHSIDSIKLLNKLLSKSLGTKVGVFLQYNTSGEEQKGGFESFEELLIAEKAIRESKGFYLQGLMTMGSIRSQDFEKSARECFAQLKELRDKLEVETGLEGLELSMGMSSDYTIAIELGTSWVRVGSAIFGPRK